MLLNTVDVVVYFRVRYISHCYAITSVCNHETASDSNIPARSFLLPHRLFVSGFGQFPWFLLFVLSLVCLTYT